MWYELQYKKGIYGKKWWTDHVTESPTSAAMYLSTGNTPKNELLTEIKSLAPDEYLLSKDWIRANTTIQESIRRIVAHNSKPKHKHV